MRRRRGITQEKLAELVQIDARHIQRIEAGDGNPSLFLIVRLAGALAVPPSSLL
ncbi:MAG: helix-turn-helix transcriptional regulator [Nitrospirae bacterium]|nr:helix-turn-helix transcriptional regulator [Nitrospirota bacterium]